MPTSPAPGINAKIKGGPLPIRPLNDDPIADWSAHLFVVERRQLILLSSTKSLYSTLMFGSGITNESQFIARALSCIQEFLKADELESVYQQFIAPSAAEVSFAKALDRSVTGSINELTRHAKWLSETGRCLQDIGFKLNEIPLASLKFNNPRNALLAMASSCRAAVARG